MPNPVTNAQFIRAVSYMAKNASHWAGDFAGNVVMKLDEANDPVRPETLERFRAEMLRHLNIATGHES